MKKKEATEGGAKKTKGMKKGWRYAIGIVVALAILAGVGVLLRMSRQLFVPPYDATQPTAQKFAEIAHWIPPKAEFDIVVDVQRVLADQALREELDKVTKGREGVAADLVAALLEREATVGMLMLVGTLGETGAVPALAVVAQGGFDERAFIPAIRAALASGRSGLVAEKVGGRTLYAESDVRDPFSFIVLDDWHIAVGTRASLVALFEDGPVKATPGAPAGDAVLFGRLTVGPRMKALLPQRLAPVENIDFSSTDGRTLVATIAGAGAVQDVRMFLEGVRTLLLLQKENDAALEKIIKGVAIENREDGVVLSCGILPLLSLWVPQK